MIIDSHQHFWRLDTGFYDWIPPTDAMLKRDFAPHDLASQLAERGVTGTILVQAANTEDEFVELCAAAELAGFVRGIVAPLEVERAGVAERVVGMANQPLLVGFRPPFTPLFDDAGTLTDAAATALDVIQSHDLAFDCLTLGPPLGFIPEMARRYPGVDFVVDHGGNPNLGEMQVSPDWLNSMRMIASHANACCKLSGLLTRLPAGSDTTILREHVAILLDLFGTDRLLWGSDWPVLTKAASYADWLELSQQLLSHLADDEIQAIFSGNTARIYKLEKRHV